MPKKKHKIPKTLKRSPKHAQKVYEKTLESAEKTYGDDRRAHQTAFAAVKHQFEKTGDHWEPKGHKGPSDPRAKRGANEKGGKSYGGVDYEGSSRNELYERAKKLGLKGISRWNKGQLAEAISKKQKRAA